ncbi:hypothetical protein [Paenibacillus sp. J22TS3]|uniref:hypothetical protein n=1 Tax=Paenibacillus sp. J22TS3 TaxID=2807192 RepID=UPI001B03851E|nr:hypothetical protein [Paenibacillus sp. J22TS3]GIP21549.1 hypothetical protein J22TS3_18240 [Paenibacillus sp. J22TS3]
MVTANASQKAVITLETKELFFLAGILGSDRLLGIDDPFRGYLSEEIAEEWESAKNSLLSKGYLTQVNNGVELEMSPQVFSQVAIAGLAERACWVRYTNEDDSFEGYLHVTDEKVVEVRKLSDAAREYQLVEIGNVRQASDDLVNRMRWNIGSPENMPALLLSRKQFNELYENSEHLSVEEISSELAESTDDQEGAWALAKCLKTRTSDGELQLSVWSGTDWETQGAAFVVNESMNWLIRMSTKDDEDWLIATPTTREQFQNMLLMWFERPSETEER